MSTFKEEISIANVGDVSAASRDYIAPEAVRSVTLDAWVDSCASTLLISEATSRQLGLKQQGTVKVAAVGGSKEGKVMEPVEVRWHDRVSVCRPWVVPGFSEVLLGAIPMEEMDVMVHPAKECLVGAHGERVTGMAMAAANCVKIPALPNTSRSLA